MDHEVNHDEAVILALGYKQEFRREFSLWTTFGVSFSVLGLLPSITSTLFYSLAYVGNAGLTWGLIVSMIPIMCVAASMAEISSAFPTSGGLYYATAMLSPPKYKALLSWIVGWSNYFVQVTGAPSVGYSTASIILTCKQLADPSYEQQTWQCFLLSIAICFLAAVQASLPTKWIAWSNSISTILNIVLLFISFVIILGGNTRLDQGLPHFNPNSFAWAIDNQTEWPNGVAMLMSFLAVIWTMSGFDSPFHLAEECSNAQVATPRAIVITAGVGGLLAFMFQMSMAYTIVDIDAAVNADLGQPYVVFLSQILNHQSTMALSSFAVVLGYFMSSACMIAASRVLFSYSRDNCFPFSKYWAHVNPHTQTPVNAVWANFFIGCLLLCLMFGGVAIDAIFSVGAIGSFISFTIPSFLRITYARKTFVPGPWNLGKWTYLSGATATAFTVLMIPIMCFPQYRGADNTLDLMNWTVVVYWGSMLLAVSWYFIYAHKIYKGPKPNIDHIDDKQSEMDVIEAVTSKGGDVVIYGEDEAPEKSSV